MLKKILEQEKEAIMPDEETLSMLSSLVKDFTGKLQRELNQDKVNADVFVGGSFAKGTLLKKKTYDVDVFVRFDWTYSNLSHFIERALGKIAKNGEFVVENVHGSRDYFLVFIKGRDVYFEVIPVTKITSPKQERNVTDSSYFHVNYVKNKIKAKKKLADEIRLAKKFCQAINVYGAESYILGFSGYALECLVIHYGSFEKMLKELSKENKDRIIIDSAKHYKKHQVLVSMNESKMRGPVILVDPTYKERNVLAALSHETFAKFQQEARKFLAKPSLSAFVEKEVDVFELEREAKKKKAELIHVKLETEKQKGDIAGTKLKKFSKFLERQMEKKFEILKSEFSYSWGSQEADFYIIARAKKEYIARGPPKYMTKEIALFKKEHKDVFEKGDKYYARERITEDGKTFVENYAKKNGKVLEQMDISGMHSI